MVSITKGWALHLDLFTPLQQLCSMTAILPSSGTRPLSEFSKTGGDTVWLKGAPLILRTKQEFVSDPVFRLCQDHGGSSCIDEAEADLGKLGIKIASFATYQYDEDFSDDILRCSSQGYDKRIVTKNNTFIRLVLPANKTR